MAERSPISWVPMTGALVAGAALAGIMGWQLNLQTIEHRITEKRSAVRKLLLSGGLPPNQEVMDYLSARETSLEQQYQSWLKRVAVPPSTEVASTDPQLYFQERLHEVQRTLERLATARTMTVPDLLGFPKELPPSDTVPRLLVQLSLIQEATEVIFGQGVTTLTSLKIEDPETVPEQNGEGTFLVRVPVRVRCTASLPQMMKILNAIERMNPLVDVRALHVVAGATEGSLDAELLLARYLITVSLQEPTAAHDASDLPNTTRAAQPKPNPPRKGTHKLPASSGATSDVDAPKP